MMRGSVEYKWRLTGISETRFEHLVTQMKFRVSEGKGQCLYELGITDNGVPKGLSKAEIDESIATIEVMARWLNFSTSILQYCTVQTDPEALYCAEILVSQRYARELDFGVAFCGAVDSGKSSLIGVLLTSTLDDGNGCARQVLFNHKHEIHSGKTSSIATRLWSVDNVDPSQEELNQKHTSHPLLLSNNNNNNNAPLRKCHPTDETNSLSSTSSPCSKVPYATLSTDRHISLMDVGGDVTKTMLFGLMCHAPDYVCLCHSAVTPPTEFLLYGNICNALRIPFFVVITKCDLIEEFEEDNYIMETSVVLNDLNRSCQVITSEGEVSDLGEWPPVVPSDAVPKVPVFLVSSVTGKGLEPLRLFLASLRPVTSTTPTTSLGEPDDDDKAETSLLNFEILIEQSFSAKDANIVRGRVASGSVSVGVNSFIGPDDKGQFYAVRIVGIHVEGSHVNRARKGDDATFALSEIPSAVDVTMKGKLLLSQPVEVCFHFLLSVHLLQGCLSTGMEPIVYTRNIRQAADIVNIQPGAGDTWRVKGRFLFRPEVVKVGSRVVLQWTNGIAAGEVKEIIPFNENK